MCREGVDTLKINVSGDAGTPSAPAERTVMSEAEIAAVSDVAHDFGKRLAAHARSAEAVKRCLHYGVEVIYHATLLDEEAKDMLTVARERVFVAPTLGNLHSLLHDAAPWGITAEMARGRGIEDELERGIESAKDLKRRGVRILPGGDYGFAWMPIGANARDIELFVELLGLTPMDAILAATKLGGEIMRPRPRAGADPPGIPGRPAAGGRRSVARCRAAAQARAAGAGRQGRAGPGRSPTPEVNRRGRRIQRK